MVTLIGSSRFPVGRDIDYSSAEEIVALGSLEANARAFMASDS